MRTDSIGLNSTERGRAAAGPRRYALKSNNILDRFVRAIRERVAVRIWALLLALIGLGTTVPELRAQGVPPSAQTPDRGARANPAAATSRSDAWRARKDYALLFATNDYDVGWEPLTNPIPDAKAIAAELHDNYGFEAEVVENPSRERVVLKIREYISKNFGDNDQLFIFFAGHGVYDDVFRQGYIVTRDSRRDDEARGTYISYDNLRAMVDSMHAKHVMLVMDACFSGTFDRRIGEAGSRGSDTYANFTFPELFANKVKFATRKFLTSGGKDYVPDGLPGHHSPFASHLLEELRTYGRDQGYLSFANVLTAVERTNPEPHWGEFGADEPGSDFFFVSKQLIAKLSNPGVTPAAGSAAPSSAARGDAVPLTNRPSIAVLGFRNLSGRSDDAWLSTAFSEWLTTELAAGQSLRAISGENVARVKQDLSLTDASGYAQDTLGRIYKSLGSDYVVSGSYTTISRQGAIRMDVRLQNTATGESIALPAETGVQNDLPDLVRKVGAQLREKLRVESITDVEAKAVKAALPSKPESSKTYAEGLQKLRAYDLLDARDSLLAAVKADPKSAVAHQALAQAWHELGYDSNAKEEAANATDLAGSLSPERRMAIEASYRKMNAQWDRAIDIYRSLWTIYPDETDYALQLADVEISAGKAKEALATLDALRVRFQGAAEDPRVDFEEALAASSLSDFKRKQEAAAHSAEKADKLGSRLLVAQAYWQDCSALLSLGDQKAAEDACSKASQASSSSAGRQVQARSYTLLANIRQDQGRSSEAMELRKQALGIARDIGSRIDIIGALTNLANEEKAQGRMDEAKTHFDEAIQLARETGNKVQLARLQLNAGILSYAKADYDGAQKMWEQAREDAGGSGDKVVVAKSSMNLAALLLQSGELGKAEDNARQALALGQGPGLPRVYASSMSTLADILTARGDLPGARKAYEDALALFTRFNDQDSIASTRLMLAKVALEQDDPGRAEELVRPAVAVFRSEKTPDDEASAHETLARVLMAQGKNEQAVEEIAAARALSLQDNAVRAAVVVTGARLSAWKGNFAEARQALDTGLAEVRRLKMAGVQLEIRLAQAEIELKSDAAAARPGLQALEQDAKTSGYLLIAAKAERLLQSR
jgi:tetratricopeptide (TPR) repeat protein